MPATLEKPTLEKPTKPKAGSKPDSKADKAQVSTQELFAPKVEENKKVEEERTVEEGTKAESDAPAALIPRLLPLADIEASDANPRDLFDAEKMEELTQSIRQYGVLQPIVVRPSFGIYDGTGSSLYTIIAGERRFRAAKAAGLTEIPAMVKPQATDRQALVLTLIENLHREDLNPMDQAHGFRTLGEMGYSQERIAQEIHSSVPVISNCLRLLKLPDGVQNLIRTGKLSRTHGLLLLPALIRTGQSHSVKTEQERPVLEVAEEAAEKGWTTKVLEAEIERRFPEPKEPTLLDVPAHALKLAVPGPEGNSAEKPAAPTPSLIASAQALHSPTAQDSPTASEASPATGSPHPSDTATSVASKPATVPPASVPPAPAPKETAASKETAAPALPPGWMMSAIKQEDWKKASDMGLWPLSNAIAEVEELTATVSSLQALIGQQALTTEGGSLSAPTTEASPAMALAAGAASELVSMMDTTEVLAPDDKQILDELFPMRESTLAEHIVAVLMIKRLRLVKSKN